jgi:Big-like domain-containing protein
MVMLVACGGNNDTNPVAPTPTPNPSATVSAVTVASAPASATTFQLTATARFSDNTSRDVTTASAWTTSNASLATVTSGGLVTAIGSGDVDVRAVYQGVTGILKMQVTGPAPRFALFGLVQEVRPNNRAVSNVRIEIVSGPDAGASVNTDDSGVFRLSNLSGLVSFQATKDGYQLWRLENLTMDQDREVQIVIFPTPPTNAAGALATARCNDGTWSWAQTRQDACTANGGGIAYGVCPGVLCLASTAAAIR